MQKIFDPIRQLWVLSTPEEKIRQALVKKMTEELGYAKNLLAIEKSLDSLAGNNAMHFPKRRVDILSYAKDIHPKHSLHPLLMIECKAIPLNRKVLEQVAGYNHYIGAFFMGIANENELRIFWRNKKGDFDTLNFLPSYKELISVIKAP